MKSRAGSSAEQKSAGANRDLLRAAELFEWP